MRPYLPTDIMPFGAYRGHRLRDVYYYNPVYIAWAIENVQDFCIDIGQFKKIGQLKPISKFLIFRIPEESENRMTPKQRTSFRLKLYQTTARIEDIKEYESLGFNIPSKEYNLPDYIVTINEKKRLLGT